jgi:hypothetical protein
MLQAVTKNHVSGTRLPNGHQNNASLSTCSSALLENHRFLQQYGLVDQSGPHIALPAILYTEVEPMSGTGCFWGKPNIEGQPNTSRFVEMTTADIPIAELIGELPHYQQKSSFRAAFWSIRLLLHNLAGARK